MSASKKHHLKSVDLFAGCGGLSLGLEQSGYETVFVNELHPDAMNTYLANRLDTTLSSPNNHSFDIMKITQSPGELDALATRLKSVHGEIDLIAGGPPCQGYSGIGHRRSFTLSKDEIPSNHLYRDMAAFVSAIQPKAFLFENVRGLLTSKWFPGGEKGEIWRDVHNAFRRISIRRGRRTLEYNIGFHLLSAADYGVPQNRPRVIMIGIRSDLPMNTGLSSLGGGFIPEPTYGAPDLDELLDDLIDTEWTPGGSTQRYPAAAKTRWQKALRTLPNGRILNKGSRLSEQDYSKHGKQIVAKFQYMIDNNGEIPESMRTKKFAQRVLPARWGDRGPSITATSLADDFVHYAQPRVPTVREWARLQTFPDWYEFKGGRTTGGRRRAGDPDAGVWTRDVPKYTQIGNAVPVLLGQALGTHIQRVLND
jgi:DNA (cytosine-5)-methyltransferase 1